MAEYPGTRAVKRIESKFVQDRVVQALKDASTQANKELTARGLKLPTQDWDGSAVRNPMAEVAILSKGWGQVLN